MSDKATGMIFAILSAFLLSLMCLFVRFAYETNANICTILFVRFLVGFIALLPLLKIQKQSVFKINKPGFTFLRAVSGTVAMLCFYTALG